MIFEKIKSKIVPAPFVGARGFLYPLKIKVQKIKKRLDIRLEIVYIYVVIITSQ